MRCSTRSGGLQCDRREGHAGECVATPGVRADVDADPVTLQLALRRLHGVLRDVRDGDAATAKRAANIGLQIIEAALRR